MTFGKMFAHMREPVPDMRFGVAARDPFVTGERRGLVEHDAGRWLKGTYRTRSTVLLITVEASDVA